MTDIQRGDTVYYRGEVWVVDSIWPDDPEGMDLRLKGRDHDGFYTLWYAASWEVQRVEQIR